MPDSAGHEADEDPANGNTRSEMLAVLRTGSTVLFVGAGCSVSAGFPTWPGLLAQLEGLCAGIHSSFVPDAAMRDDDPLKYADRIQDHIRMHTGNLARYHAKMLDLFRGPARIEQFHRDLVALPCRGFLTTNYDNTIEAALMDIERRPPEKHVLVPSDNPRLVRDFLNGLTHVGEGRMVAHLHGFYRLPQTIVLSERDYLRVYGDGAGTADLADFLRNILSTWSLVFVGFSFADPVLRVFLQAATDKYQTWNQQVHFAVIDTSERSKAADVDRAAQLKARYGIETVFYDNDDGSHRSLYELFQGVRRDLGLPREPGLSDINARMVEGMQG